jgi:exopolysaccharide production protein ExoQ
MQKYSLAQTTAIVFLILSLEIDLSVFGISEEIKRFIILIILGFFGLMRFSSSLDGTKNIFKQTHIKYYFYYLLWIVFSLIWTVSFSESLSSVFGLLFSIIFVLSIYQRIELENLVEALKRNSYLIFILSLLVLFLIPGYATSPLDFFRLKGIMIHSQRLAILAGLMIILVVYQIKQNQSKSSDKILLLLSLFVLFFTKTRAFSTFIFLVVMFQVFAEVPKKKIILMFLLFGMVLLLVDLNAIIQDLYSRGDEDLTTLTGRTMLWLDTIYYITKNPILGYGFGSFKTGIISYSFWEPPHAHNMWLHTMFETGIIGTILLNIFLFKFFKLVKKYKKISFAYYLIIYIILASFTGIVIGYLISPFYIIFLLFVFLETEKIITYEKSISYYGLLQ